MAEFEFTTINSPSTINAVSGDGGKVATGTSNGNPATVNTASRKDRRKEWWQKSKSKGPTKEDNTEDGGKPENPTKKLRNRSAIPKPDSLKYEPDLNKGFHTKLLHSLFVESPSKKKKKKGRQQDRSPNKRKTSDMGSVNGSPKKSKPEPEVFDTYKFSLKLINGEVDTSKDGVAGKNSKDKYVLFIGNLPFDITREQLEEHFRKTGGIKSVRIPREKGTEKGRGFAYMEFDGRISHGIALRLHQTTLNGRKINVEFTSIGGGKSAARKEKLKQKNMKRRRMKMQ